MNELSESKKFQFPKISDGAFLTSVGILVTFAGFIKSIMYYDMFGISIAGFLDFSEILTLFASDLLLYFSVFFVIVLIEYNSWYYTSFFKFIDTFGVIIVIVSGGVFICLLIHMLKIEWLMRLLHFSWIKELLNTRFNSAQYYRLIFSILFVNYIILGFFSSKDETFMNMFKFFGKLLILIAGIFYHGRYTAYKVYAGIEKLPVASIIKTDHSIITISVDTIYLGKTKDYYFLFSKKPNQAIVLKAEEVASLIMRSAPALEFHISEDSLKTSKIR